MLAEIYPEETLKSILIPREDWHPFPATGEREPWEALPESIRQAHITRGESRLNYEWPSIPAIRFLDFVRTGDRNRYQGLSFGRRRTLCDLVIAECLEGQGRFLDDITNGIWAICEESFWGVPAHIGVQKAGSGLPDVAEPIVDLFAAETSTLLAWTIYLLSAKLNSVSPLIVPRVELEINRRILTPLLKRDDFGWMGFGGRRVNNWNPWICSNWLTAALLIEQDETRRVKQVAKAVRALDNFIDPYPKDGGCDEGPGYWGRAGASLYDCLELLHSSTNGEIDVYDDALIQNIGKFIYRVQIQDRYFINFADAPAMLTPSPALVYGFGKRINDPQMMALGAWSACKQDIQKNGLTDSIGRLLPALFSLADVLEAEPSPPLPRDVWLDEIEVMVARDGAGTADGLFVAVKGGHNAESHNHNDIGHFIVYIDGKPVIVDAGVETYTANTFSSRRYEIWTMQSGYHSLPTVNGVQQAPGRQYAARNVAYRTDDQLAELSLNIAGAYPKEAHANTWVRTVTLNRGRNITMTEVYELGDMPSDLCLNLLTPCQVALQDGGVIALKPSELPDGRLSGDAQLHYEANKLTACVEEITIEDGRLRQIWGDRLSRIILQAETPTQKNNWTLRLTKGRV